MEEQALGDMREMGSVLLNYGNLKRLSGDYEGSEALLQKAVPLLEGSGASATRSLAAALTNLGLAYRQQYALTGANRNDSQEALALVDAIPPLCGARWRPRQRPDCVVGDRGYDATAIRHGLRSRHIVPALAMRRTKHGSGLGRWRWVVERTFAWLNQFRRLRDRYDKRADIREAFLALGCALICWQSLRKTWRTA